MRRWAATATVALAAVLGVAGSEPAVDQPAAAAATAGLGFELRSSRVTPRRVYFAGPRRAKLRFRFAASRRTDLRIRVIDVRAGRTVAAWRLRDAEPRRTLTQRWNGVDHRGRAARDGRYEFRVGPRGRTDRYAGRFRLRGHAFPVEGRHRDRGPVGEYGAPRNGGRTHEGFDILADCGTPLVAARGGRVRRVGYDPRLYGYFLLINGRKTGQRYFYSHLIGSPAVKRGEQVNTGQRVGRVGRTGNAASTPCHLHFELHRNGRPVDPERALRRWDRWS
jgi:murein DD-endopeptidase MepM/ murein hydrolase activator NlpD